MWNRQRTASLTFLFCSSTSYLGQQVLLVLCMSRGGGACVPQRHSRRILFDQPHRLFVRMMLDVCPGGQVGIPVPTVGHAFRRGATSAQTSSRDTAAHALRQGMGEIFAGVVCRPATHGAEWQPPWSSGACLASFALPGPSGGEPRHHNERPTKSPV